MKALDCCRLCASVYNDPPSGWDHWFETADVVCGVKVVGDETVLVFRGSVTAEDWMRDAEGWPVWDPEVGFVHAGFLDGMDDLLAQISAAGLLPTVLTGHSLGGARARVAAAKLIVRGTPPRQLTVFGSPKPGFENLSRVIQKSEVAHISYRNRNDPVPLVPAILPYWQHPEEPTPVDGGSIEGNFQAFRDHFIFRYTEALSREEVAATMGAVSPNS